MSKVLQALAAHVIARPGATALVSGAELLSYAATQSAVGSLAAMLCRLGVRCVGLIADNGLGWAIADLAALQAAIACLPLPLFFSPGQRAHALASAGVDLLLIDARLPLPPLPAGVEDLSVELPTDAQRWLRAYRLPLPAVALPPQTCKITYTSGTTGAPKGVCLGIAEQEAVAQTLVRASAADRNATHLCVLPLATLLENIGGLYAPLLAGATTHLPPLAEVGLSGASGFDVMRLLSAIGTAAAGSVILVPQMLQALVMAIEAGVPRPPSLRFVAIGGAPVSPRLLQRAARLGLPVYEGYGLSECASVVALNALDDARPGSVGKPLPHVRVVLAADGEILVYGNAFRGYVGEPSRDPAAPVATGDLGCFDADGFLHLTGRKKNIFVTAFGRNVAPEWVERELCLQPAIAQAAVFGEAAPWNVAVIVSRSRDAAVIQAAIDAVNADLPDYARVRRWIVASHPFSTDNDQATANGRLRRASILAVYGRLLEQLYEGESA